MLIRCEKHGEVKGRHIREHVLTCPRCFDEALAAVVPKGGTVLVEEDGSVRCMQAAGVCAFPVGERGISMGAELVDRPQPSVDPQELAEALGAEVVDSVRDLDPDWATPCEVCGQVPTVPLTGLCGPCTWGESATVGGNWDT